MRPGTLVLDRGHGTVQIGTDRRWAVCLNNISFAELTWLRSAATHRHVPLESSARRLGVSAERCRHISSVLRGSTHLLPHRDDHQALESRTSRVSTADARALGSIREDGDGCSTLAARQRSTIRVSGLGRLGGTVALLLASAGVGTLVLRPEGLVQVDDVGLGAFGAFDVSWDRHSALARSLHRVEPSVTVTAHARPDVTVNVHSHAVDPADYYTATAERLPHLPVVVNDADVTVGPMVIPGMTACTMCVALHHADDDPAWPTLTTQLARSPGIPCETTLAAMAASLAASQVLAYLDGNHPSAVNHLIEVSLPEALPRLRTVTRHPDCPCREHTTRREGSAFRQGPVRHKGSGHHDTPAR